MSFGKTVTGKGFEYSGSLASGLVVHHQRTQTKVPLKVIEVIRKEIDKRSPVLMGACLKPLVPDSVGETLQLKHRVSPQIMSYVLPLLIEEGFCRISGRRPVRIYKNQT
jgi:hypothetical protein